MKTRTNETAATTRARRFYNRLVENTDMYYADLITYEEHGTTQRQTWDDIAAAGATDAVLALWRAENPAVARR